MSKHAIKTQFAAAMLLVLLGTKANAQFELDDIFGGIFPTVEQAAEVDEATTENAVGGEDESDADNGDGNAKDSGEKKELTFEQKFEKFAKEIEEELEKREVENNKNLKVVRELQNEQRRLYREHHEEIRKLANQRKTKEVRSQIEEHKKSKQLAGARLNELEIRGEIFLANASSSGNRNNDLMQKLSRYSSTLAREDRNEFQRNSKVQQKFNDLMQQVMASQHRHYSQQGFTDLTEGLVEEIPYENARYPQHPWVENGTIQESREALNRLLKLTWSGESIAVDRGHWDELFANRSPGEMSKDVDLLLQKHDVTMPKTDRHGMPLNRGMMEQNVLRLFDNLRQQFGNSGRSSSSSGTNVTVSFSSQAVNSELQVRGSSFRFEFREKNFPRRLLMVEQEDSRLSITVYGKVVLRFQQLEDGSIKVVETSDN
ncbi:MAG: hypothetical protein KDB27_08490, partial [Planctomycetales bacterium]|nr:hypothetical protein [Planctomycetales bacterium]